MISNIEDLRQVLLKHHEYRRNCLNLIASELITGPTCRLFGACDLAYRYSTYAHDPLKRRYPGGKYIAEMEVEARRLASELFEGKYVDFRPLGGQMAGYGPIFALANKGDTVIEEGVYGEKIATGLFSTDVREEGGFREPSRLDSTPPSMRGLLKVRYPPFDYSKDNIDVDGTAKLIRKEKPKLVILGRALISFPEPVKEVAEVAKEVGARVLYDACHVSLFIIAKRFPNPLKEGVDILSTSTTKTIPGPQGGMFATDDEELHKKIGTTLWPAFVANDHYARIPQILVMLLEMKKFGKAFADQIVRNSKALGKAMVDQGFKAFAAERGFSETHQVRVDLQQFGDPAKVRDLLDKANIFGSSRIGTGEITRIGMKEKDMPEIATFFRRVLVDEENPERVAKDVGKFVSNFNKLQFTFDAGADPYKALF